MRPQSEPSYRPDIDGIRAIAVTSVVLFHAGIPPFRSGFVGVDIFFVISGYLIGGIIIRDVSRGKFDFVKFYARRARRILPALFLVVLFTCVAGWLLLDASEYRYVGATATSALLAVSNFSFWRFQDYFAPDARLKPLLMTWSLGVEEQFYFLFPFLIIFTARLAAKRIIAVLAMVTLASFALSVSWSNAYPAAAFYLLPSRVWELGTGAILAAWESTKPGQFAAMMQSRWLRETLSWIGLLLVVIGITAFDEFTRFPGTMALIPVIGAACLIATGGSSINDRLLSSRPMVFIGLISYSWYLWHWPLMSYLRIVVPYEPPMWAFAIVTAGSLAVAIISWRFVEQPFRSMRLAAAPTLVRYAAALGVALALPVVVRESDGLPARLPEAAKSVEAVATLGRGGKCLALFEDAPNLSSECVSSSPDQSSVALLGDSHAGALADAFRELATQQNLGFRIFAKSSCRPLLDVGIWSKEYPDLEEFLRRVHGAKLTSPDIGSPSQNGVSCRRLGRSITARRALSIRRQGEPAISIGRRAFAGQGT